CILALAFLIRFIPLSSSLLLPLLFLFIATAPSVLYTLSLHDALPIWSGSWCPSVRHAVCRSSALRTSWPCVSSQSQSNSGCLPRSEEHTSELQSHLNLVCRLLLEKKKKLIKNINI